VPNTNTPASDSAAGLERVARLAPLEPDRDLAGRALGVDLDQLGIHQVRDPVDRAPAVLVVADPGDELGPAAGLAEVPGHVGRGAAELVAVGEPVPQQLAPDDDGVTHAPPGAG
jgi:hypothetical protein